METYNLLKEFIKPELLILVPVLYLIGVGIKRSNCVDRFIPAILGTISTVLSVLYLVSTTTIHDSQDVTMLIFTGLTQGILLAGASVYANQLYKQHNRR